MPVSKVTTFVTEIILSVILSLIYTAGLCIFIQNFKINTNKAQISLNIMIIAYILFEITGIVRAIYRQKIEDKELKYDHDHNIYYMSYLLFFIFDIIWAVSFNYFLISRLQFSFKNTFLEINHYILITMFVIYLLSISFYFGSQIWSDVITYYHPNIAVPTENTLDALRIQYTVIVILFQSIILSVFNSKLFKLIKQTSSYNRKNATVINQQQHCKPPEYKSILLNIH